MNGSWRVLCLNLAKSEWTWCRGVRKVYKACPRRAMSLNAALYSHAKNLFLVPFIVCTCEDSHESPQYCALVNGANVVFFFSYMPQLQCIVLQHHHSMLSVNFQPYKQWIYKKEPPMPSEHEAKTWICLSSRSFISTFYKEQWLICGLVKLEALSKHPCYMWPRQVHTTITKVILLSLHIGHMYCKIRVPVVYNPPRGRSAFYTLVKK